MRTFILGAIFIFVSACSVPTKMPGVLPEPTGEAIFMSIAREHEIDSKYLDLSIDELSKFDDYYYIIDSKRISDKDFIIAYIDSLKSGFGTPEAYAMCFEPRHVLKYKSLYGEVIAQICFECGSVAIEIGEWGRSEYFVKPVASKVNDLYRRVGIRVPLDPKILTK